MSVNETRNLKLKYLFGQQASKHITVNEAFARIDGVLSRHIEFFKINLPPEEPEEGTGFIIGESPSGEWIGHKFDVCYRINGGWEFFSPPVGWSVWVESLCSVVTFIGKDWLIGAMSVGSAGQSTSLSIINYRQSLVSGDRVVTEKFIPDKTIVIGVTALVKSELIGSNTWSLGSLDSYNRYGENHSAAFGAKIIGVTSTPLTYFGDSELVITPENGKTFDSGEILFCVHAMNIYAPSLEYFE